MIRARLEWLRGWPEVTVLVGGWMTTSSAALGDNGPIDLLDTGFGYETVVDVLRRIEFGVFS